MAELRDELEALTVKCAEMERSEVRESFFRSSAVERISLSDHLYEKFDCKFSELKCICVFKDVYAHGDSLGFALKLFMRIFRLVSKHSYEDARVSMGPIKVDAERLRSLT